MKKQKKKAVLDLVTVIEALIDRVEAVETRDDGRLTTLEERFDSVPDDQITIVISRRPSQ